MTSRLLYNANALVFMFVGLESNYMSASPSETPGQFDTPQELCAEDWLGLKNTRTLFHLDRKVILEAVRDKLAQKEPLIAALGGFGLFRAYADSSEYTILIANHSLVAGELNTVISVNQRRQPADTEPVFPDGKVLELLDVNVPSRSRWLNTAHETMFRGHHEHAWPKPEYATMLQARNDKLDLFGNLAEGKFLPVPARDMWEVGEDATALWGVYNALSFCNEISLCEGITTISTPAQT